MDLSPYVISVQRGLTTAAALADNTTQEVAGRMGAAMESAVRLALLDALADAAAAIGAEVAPTSVELRVSAGNPEFIVRVPAASAQPTMLQPPLQDTLATDEGELDEPAARISLRLPASVKAKVDEVADRDGVSTNAWLIRAVVDALADRRRPRGGGWRGGPTPPMPPVPPMSPIPTPTGPSVDLPFGPTHVHGSDHQSGRGPSGGVQGWVR